jgi:hypothetical protein
MLDRFKFVFGLLLLASPALAKDDATGLELFEKKIRPVLEEHCYKCHSAEAEKNNKLRGGLLLDSKAGIAAGGDSGPAFVAGKPKESLLIKSLHYTTDTKMPPKGKLPETVIRDFEQWVTLGAPDPRAAETGSKKQIGMSLEEGRKFWSYQLPKLPAIPEVKQQAWASNEIDRFILASLEKNTLQPNPPADPAVLIRRLFFDLTGLPPTPEQVDAFVADPSEAAYAKLVDTLLNSPQFGERWGRHWLDVARFGESLTLRGFILKDAWRYRDYVIEAFNSDVPFDRFLKQQIAGDLLPAASTEEARRNLIATTFLALGNTNLEEQDKKQLVMDFVDEQLDVIGKGLLGQTITCARCHDHKFDPIPTKDYYSLAGILKNSKSMEHSNVSKWIEVPLPTDPATEAEIKRYEGLIAQLQTKIKEEKAKLASNKPSSKKAILPISEVTGIVVDDAAAKKVGNWMVSTHSGFYIGEGYVHDMDGEKGNKTLSFEPQLPATGKYEVRLAYSPGASRSNAVPVTVFGADGEKTINVNMQLAPNIEGRFVSLGQFKFEKTGQSFVIVANEGTKGHVTADAVVFIPLDDKAEQGNGNKDDMATVKALEAELKRLQDNGPKRETAISVIEEKKIEEVKVHVRGSVHNLGELAPRGFLRVTNPDPVAFPKSQSGRKELADWIASDENPLTSRVMVNRLWHWLFGSGLVRTVDNFGTTGEKPSHPELLDYLAVRFVQENWSVKRLLREMVLSKTYRQSSKPTPETLAADPENRLLGRANRKRLEAEAIRDNMLVVSGQLNSKSHGASFSQTLGADYNFKSNDTRRSVYLPVFRNSIPELFEVFDFADASMVVGRRNTSTVAPQALYFLNNPFPIEQARQAASRLLSESHSDDDSRIRRSYRLTLGREPTSQETEIALKFLKQNSDPKAAWASIYQTLFATADFRFLN